jgi:hypothetical protein
VSPDIRKPRPPGEWQQLPSDRGALWRIPRWRGGLTTADSPVEAVLIRPDGYVAWAGQDAGELEKALRTWFGTPE